MLLNCRKNQNEKYNNTKENQNHLKPALSESEIDKYLKIMKIQNFELPKELGYLYLIGDGNNLNSDDSSLKDRKVILGISSFYNPDRGGWSQVFIEYSTYDFEAGAEFNTFATKNDYYNVLNNKKKNIIEKSGIKGFKKCEIFERFDKKWLIYSINFLFEDFYVSIVYNNLNNNDVDNYDTICREIEKGNYPDSDLKNLEIIDEILNAIKFIK